MSTFDMAEHAKKARASMTTPSEWSMTDYSETPARNGVAWSGVIRRNGSVVGRCYDAGMGGAVDFDWNDIQHAAAFKAEAESRYGTIVEVEADFANDLATAAQHNAADRILFITDDSDVSMGETFVLKAGVTLAQAKRALTDPTGPYARKNPMIWDTTESVFVPVADIKA